MHNPTYLEAHAGKETFALRVREHSGRASEGSLNRAPGADRTSTRADTTCVRSSKISWIGHGESTVGVDFWKNRMVSIVLINVVTSDHS